MLSAGDFYVNNVTPVTGRAGVSLSWGGAYTGFTVGKTVFTDVLPEGNARVYINLREQGLMLTIRQLYDVFRVSREEDVLALLRPYIGAGKAVDAIRRLGLLDPVKLASLVVWLTDVLGLRVTSVELVEDLETGQPQFIGIYIDDCGWDEWKILSRTVKKQLVSEGFDDVAGRVALVCRQAFRTQRS